MADWETMFRVSGYSNRQIELIRNSGFYGAVYRNTNTGEITVAYRGTETGGVSAFRKDFVTDTMARMGIVDMQYKAASDLALFTRKQYPDAPLFSCTGHSLGGGLATYGCLKAGIPTVTTFNSARSPIFSKETNAGQINVAVSGDLIGDANTVTPFGSGRLPGMAYAVRSTADDGATGTHSIDGIIGGLSDVAR